ncbi:MAG: adenosylmethionine--8-amino-7-oxononanoate transaminase [Rickettsiales bacterium]|nr:adenosylmethionine--8-amino-7-oxononanoate transaminase [Rickettsiales bacterium]
MKKKLLKFDKDYIWHPFNKASSKSESIIISSAKDDRLFDIDGNEYIDLISSWWVNIHGHGKSEIVEKIYDQSKRLEQVIFAGFTHEPAIKLAKRLTEILPKNLSRVFFSDNGSTSVEIALKVAYQYWYNKKDFRDKFVALKGGYHGDTLGAMSVGYSSGFYKPFEDLVFKTFFVPFPDDWRGNNSIQVEEQKSLKKVERIINSHGNRLAAVIIEPLVQGASGMRMCRPSYLNKVVRKFQENKILVIFDEVMTGFGRTGKMFASEYLDVVPDIICLAKSLTGGYLPLAATVFKEFIHKEFLDMNLDKSFLHGHSFSANPIACVAALKSLDLFSEEKTLDSVCEIENIHKKGLNFLINNPKVSKIRFLGDIAAFDIIGFDKGYGANIGEILKKNFLKRGYLIRPLGNTLYLMPPYCIEKHTLTNVYSVIDEELRKIKI